MQFSHTASRIPQYSRVSEKKMIKRDKKTLCYRNLTPSLSLKKKKKLFPREVFKSDETRSNSQTHILTHTHMACLSHTLVLKSLKMNKGFANKPRHSTHSPRRTFNFHFLISEQIHSHSHVDIQGLKTSKPKQSIHSGERE